MLQVLFAVVTVDESPRGICASEMKHKIKGFIFKVRISTPLNLLPLNWYKEIR